VSRIAARFAELRSAGRGALIPFLEAWDPDGPTSMALLHGMPQAGADLIEIGMPFTDPMADGPIIQAAGKRALKAGVKVARVLAMVRDFRTEDDATPVILMGYLNPILSYGVERFCADAAGAGVDGLIIVDLPTEEADMLLPYATARGIDVIRLVAPTTDDARLPHVLEGCSGFVYYVSITGITGTHAASTEHLEQAIPRIRKVTDLPIAVGVGIKRPDQVAGIGRVADAVVVGSALVAVIGEGGAQDVAARVERAASELVAALPTR